jgi:hypothetical protein
MRDINRGLEISPEREARLKAEAFFDAAEYLKFMREKNPDSVRIVPGVGIKINAIEGDKFFRGVKEKLKLSSPEIALYLGFLAERAEQILKNQASLKKC